MKRWMLFLVFLLGLGTTNLFADGFTDMVDSANRLLHSLTPEQLSKALYDQKHEDRTNWHYFPKVRLGLPLKEMTPDQRHLAMAFLNSGLSNRGFLKAMTIMALEQVLHEIEKSNTASSFTRDPELYYFAFFGQPDVKGTWSWRVEGHHLSVNFTIVDGKLVSTTPLFMGTNPALVHDGPLQGTRVLDGEEDLARSLIKSLSDEQKKSAILDATAPADIITRWNRKVQPLEPPGLSIANMDPKQSEILLLLIKEYVHRIRPIFATDDMKRIEDAGPEKIHFGWAGGLEPGQPHYYRIQGPTFLLEYDDTQNNANHIHSVWRDFDKDFGEDVLLQHYQQSADHQAAPPVPSATNP